jgi:MoaA/NifB/PqqE/SkfB family radical SAM enzyme
MDKDNQGNMDFDLYTRLIDQCVRHRVYSVKLSWRGEPLLNADLFRMVRYAKEKGIAEVAFLTNGQAFTPETIEEAVISGLDWLSFSIDGLYDTYQSIRKPASFEDTVAGIELFRELKAKHHRRKPFVKVQTIYSAVEGEPQAYIDFWKRRVDKVLILADQVHGTKIDHDPDFICQYPWQRLNITWDGKVSQCTADYGELNRLGDATVTSLYDIWHGEKAEEVRKLHANHQRLKLAPCCICCMGGKLVEDSVEAGSGKKIASYAGQDLSDTIRTGIGDGAVSAAGAATEEEKE